MIQSSGFYDYAWNPVTGCLHGCPYCYAARDYKRWGLSFEPTFHEDRLIEPYKAKHSRIFVTHYTDLMGDFIPIEWVNKVLSVCADLKKHTFIFISKKPENYKKFTWPDNCIIGVTIESKEKYFRAEAIKGLLVRQMASIEPIQGSLDGLDFTQFELLVIGGIINSTEKVRAEWVNSVKHNNIFYKPNVRALLK